MVAEVPPVPADTMIQAGCGARSASSCLKMVSAMLLLPRLQGEGRPAFASACLPPIEFGGSFHDAHLLPALTSLFLRFRCLIYFFQCSPVCCLFSISELVEEVPPVLLGQPFCLTA